MALSDTEVEANHRGSLDDLEASHKQGDGSTTRRTKAARAQSMKSRPRPRNSLQRRPSAIARFKRRFSRQKDALRVAVFGACEVGKSAVVSRIRANTFPVEYEPTFEECLPHSMLLSSRFPEVVEFIDTSGGVAEEYVGMRNRVAASADAFILMFSVKQMSSLQYLQKVMEGIRDAYPQLSHADIGSKCLLVGNQAQEENIDEIVAGTDDVEEALFIDPRAVSADDADEFARQWGINESLETSALSSFGISELEVRIRIMLRRARSASVSSSGSEPDTKEKMSFFKLFRLRARAKVPSPIPSVKENESPATSKAATPLPSPAHKKSQTMSTNSDLVRGAADRYSLRAPKTPAEDDSQERRPRSKTFSLSGALRRSFKRSKSSSRKASEA